MKFFREIKKRNKVIHQTVRFFPTNNVKYFAEQKGLQDSVQSMFSRNFCKLEKNTRNINYETFFFQRKDISAESFNVFKGFTKFLRKKKSVIVGA